MQPIMKLSILKRCPMGYIECRPNSLIETIVSIVHLYVINIPRSINVIQIMDQYLKNIYINNIYLLCTGCVCSSEYEIWICLFRVPHFQYINPLKLI